MNEQNAKPEATEADKLFTAAKKALRVYAQRPDKSRRDALDKVLNQMRDQFVAEFK